MLVGKLHPGDLVLENSLLAACLANILIHREQVDGLSIDRYGLLVRSSFFKLPVEQTKGRKAREQIIESMSNL